MATPWHSYSTFRPYGCHPRLAMLSGGHGAGQAFHQPGGTPPGTEPTQEGGDHEPQHRPQTRVRSR